MYLRHLYEEHGLVFYYLPKRIGWIPVLPLQKVLANSEECKTLSSALPIKNLLIPTPCI